MLLTPDDSAWLAVFGRFHVVFLHLPIGLLPGIFLLEFGAVLIGRPNPRGPVITLAVLTAVAAAAALASGLVLSDEKTDSVLLGQHKNVAIAMAIVCGLLPILAAFRARAGFRVALIVSLMLAVWAGHLGGSLTHKKGFLFKPLDKANVSQPQNTGLPPQSLFEQKIAPIFKRVCTSCHNEDKGKGDLLLTTKEGILCADRDEEERVLVPGSPEESLLIELCELPIDDEDHMPPADEDQLTQDELALLKKWILDGCKFE